MGMDVSAVLAYGVRIPESFYISDEDISVLDELEILLDDSKNTYPNILVEIMGSCDDSLYFLCVFSKEVNWGSTLEIMQDDFNIEYLDQLEAICTDLDIDFDPGWHLGSYVSY